MSDLDKQQAIEILREFICEFWVDKEQMRWRRTSLEDGLEMVHHAGDTLFFGDSNHRTPDDKARFDLIVKLANATPFLYRALTAPPDSGWRTMESAPLYVAVIVCTKLRVVGEAHRVADGWHWANGRLIPDEVTHWRPLPAPPSPAKEG